MSGRRGGERNQGGRPPIASNRLLIFLTVGVGTFMSALDGSVVNTTLPVMMKSLGANVALAEWVITAYLLVVSGLLLGVGRMGDLRGHKRVYIFGFVVFIAGSLLCALSPNIGALIGFRAFQAIGASMLFANAPAILTRSFPPEQRGRVLGAQGTMTYLGLTVGPSLGGWLATTFGWRSIFTINLPVGLLALTLAVFSIQSDEPKAAAEPFDFLGAALFFVGLVALLTALDQGHAWGWRSLPTLGIGFVALLILMGFVLLELRKQHPMLDLSLFRNRVFSAATVSAVLNYACVYAVLFVVPLTLIQAWGMTARGAGVVLTAQPLVMAVVAPISGALSDRIGSRTPATLGMVVLAFGLAFLGEALVSGSQTTVAGALAVVGLGVGIFVSPNNSALMGAAPRNRQGIASGILATSRNVGMALGIGLAGAIFNTAMATSGNELHAARISLLAASGIALLGAVTAFARER